MKKIFLLICTYILFSGLRAQNHSFQAVEKIKFTVYYTVVGIYINAGSASFTVSQTNDPNANIYHFVGEGATNSRYDWIFKVRDRYESYFIAEAI